MSVWSRIKDMFGSTRDDSNGGSGGEASGAPVSKGPAEVAKRLVVTALVADLAESVLIERGGARGEGIERRKRVLDRLVGLGLTPADLEAEERDFVLGLRTGRIAEQSVRNALWRVEAAVVLEWALGRRDSIPEESAPSDSASQLFDVPTDAGGYQELLRQASLRPIHEVLAARHEWTVRLLSLEGEQIPDEDRSRYQERLRALRWLSDAGVAELWSTPIG